MTLPEAEQQATESKQRLLALYVKKNELSREIADAEEDNETAQRMLTILSMRGKREALPLVKVTDEEIKACNMVAGEVE
jgi:hypothetical protein